MINFALSSMIDNLDSHFSKKVHHCKKLIEKIDFAYYNPEKLNESYIDISISKKRKQHYISLEIGGMLLIFLAIGIQYL